MHSHERTRGFTLVELMVAISIILVMLGVLMASFSDARQGSRDKERVGDIAALEFAISAYREANQGSYPEYTDPVLIGSGGGIDDELIVLSRTELVDPRDGDGDFGYYYSPNFTCGEERYIALYAASMEQERNGNVSEVCPEGSDLDGNPNAYLVLIEGPLSDGMADGDVEFDNTDEWWGDDGIYVNYEPPAPPAEEVQCDSAMEEC